MTTADRSPSLAPVQTDRSAQPPAGAVVYTHQQILKVLFGLMCALFVSSLSSTIVANALPSIMASMHGGETAYTWVVTTLLLAQTSTLPIWGKLADQFSRKLLLQLSVIIFVVGSVLAGLAQSIPMLLAARAIQGIGVGGVQSLSQTVIAAIVPPRQRGRYAAYLGVNLFGATLLGPLVGGPLVSTPWIGWRACFFAGLPIAIVALVALQRVLRLPIVRRPVHIDYLGSALVVSGVSLLLVWISLAGAGLFAWRSSQTALLLPASLVLLAFALHVERRAIEPVIPLRLLRNRTIALVIVATSLMGVSIFSAALFLSEYFQLAKGHGPSMAGMMTLPMTIGLMISSWVTGRMVTHRGKWKSIMVAGAVVMTVGAGLLSTIDASSNTVLVLIYILILGLGYGSLTQNLLVAVQNVTPMNELGTTSATVAFCRSLGGAMGVALLGAALAAHVHHDLVERFTALGLPTDDQTGRVIPDLSALSGATLRAVQESYGAGIALVFGITVPILCGTILALLFVKEIPLRTRNEPVTAHDRSAREAGTQPREDDTRDAGTGRDARKTRRGPLRRPADPHAAAR